MKLYHLGLWIFAIPTFVVAETAPTTGIIYINARIVTIPCQPQVASQIGYHSIQMPTYELKINFSHCKKMTHLKTWLPLTLRFENQQHVLLTAPQNNTVSFSIPVSNSTHFLGVNYD